MWNVRCGMWDEAVAVLSVRSKHYDARTVALRKAAQIYICYTVETGCCPHAVQTMMEIGVMAIGTSIVVVWERRTSSDRRPVRLVASERKAPSCSLTVATP